MRGARIAGALCTLALGVVLGQASCAATEDVSPGTGASTSTTSTGGRGGGGGGTTTTTTTTTTSSGGGKDGGTGGAGGGTGGAGGGVGGAGGGGVGGAGGAGGSGGSGGSGGTGGNCAAIEVCNGLDDTCNGQIDEGDPGGNVPCMAAALGECKFGTTHCQNGAVKCVAALPVPEVCDGLDNNCDGNVDEGNPGGGIQCMTGLLGLCANGITSCQGVNGVMCVPSVTPGQLPESCNGLDDDCDGLTDDGIVQVGQPCTANGFVGICQFGTYICPSVQPIQLTCDHPAPGTVQETCNGQDDDCNGTIDDPALLNNLPCASGFPGVCAAGHTLCVGGSSSCVPNIQPGTQTEICNNVDDNCNGQTDEMNPNPACTTQNPGAQFVQSWNCNAGTCEIAQCQSGHADIDTAPGNGCECTTDAYANSCAVAGTVSVPSNGTVNMVGKIETANGSDFLTFNFTVPAVGSPYHPKIELTDSAGGQYAMDVLVNCNNAAGCSTTGGANNENGIQVNVWEQNYNAYTAGAGCCSDNTPRVGSVKVRVYRKFANQPTCASYTVTGTNL